MVKGITAPIIGITSVDKIKEAVEAIKITLTAEEVEFLTFLVPSSAIGKAKYRY